MYEQVPGQTGVGRTQSLWQNGAFVLSSFPLGGK